MIYFFQAKLSLITFEAKKWLAGRIRSAGKLANAALDLSGSGEGEMQDIIR